MMLPMQGGPENLLLRSAVDLLNGSALKDNDEAMCEMLETICNPNPAPPSWQKYGEVRRDSRESKVFFFSFVSTFVWQTLQEYGLLETIYRIMRQSVDKPRVLGYAAKVLGTMAGRDDITQANMYGYPNLLNFLTEQIEAFRTNTTVVGNLVYLLHFVTEITGWHGKNKVVKLMDHLLKLIEGGFVYKEEDKSQVGPMWKLTWTVVIQVRERERARVV